MGVRNYLNMMQPVYGIEATTSHDAGETDWVDLTNYLGVCFFLISLADTADSDITLSLRQAQSASGTGAKALAPRAWYLAQAADLTAATTFVASTDATLELEGMHENLVKVEVDAAELDEGFTHVQLQHDDGGSLTKLLACIPVAVGPSTRAVPTELPSAI